MFTEKFEYSPTWSVEYQVPTANDTPQAHQNKLRYILNIYGRLSMFQVTSLYPLNFKWNSFFPHTIVSAYSLGSSTLKSRLLKCILESNLIGKQCGILDWYFAWNTVRSVFVRKSYCIVLKPSALMFGYLLLITRWPHWGHNTDLLSRW